MKTLVALLLPFVFVCFVSCALNDSVNLPETLVLNEDLAHFDIYIELLPDSSLNIDEQSQQKYRLRLMSRGGYHITMYKLTQQPNDETVIRDGDSSHVGNFKALDMPLGTYRIVIEDVYGTFQELIITPAPGKLTMLTFGFYIPG